MLFVAQLEDVLDVYKRIKDSSHPLVCMDECPKQLIGQTRPSMAAEPGKAERFDTEYVRNGTCNLFMVVAPLLGRRRVEVTERRTSTDWAEQIFAENGSGRRDGWQAPVTMRISAIFFRKGVIRP